ncbi:uncharacterized protein BCR38DRAFT_59156 [Pseudomassariella vexata]|uniref:Uncharacterized protein n=1 Tax=Pseudomassariella vexata TaxID=1141098 RepID=A0A1Y2DJX3_9PEZI|nr:uncharacterized protein BCR38DRAFT_59156 [Pseudomassariella vexata]ORY59552.1 hypothetical protein BCR38DRAFT_59156 [Pseudomassariella vexata]
MDQSLHCATTLDPSPGPRGTSFQLGACTLLPNIHQHPQASKQLCSTRHDTSTPRVCRLTNTKVGRGKGGCPLCQKKFENSINNVRSAKSVFPKWWVKNVLAAPKHGALRSYAAGLRLGGGHAIALSSLGPPCFDSSRCRRRKRKRQRQIRSGSTKVSLGNMAIWLNLWMGHRSFFLTPFIQPSGQQSRCIDGEDWRDLPGCVVGWPGCPGPMEMAGTFRWPCRAFLALT